MFRYEKEMRVPVLEFLSGHKFISAVEFWLSMVSGPVDIAACLYGPRPGAMIAPVQSDRGKARWAAQHWRRTRRQYDNRSRA